MQRAFISLLPLATLSCLIPFTAQAQVTPDGTTSTTVNQDGNNFTINQGNRVGDNLFHSFNEFSVPTLGSAVFNNAGDIANIFSRVTGSNISNIDGLIGANGAANLFLINPNGIIFGQNASLNLGGSFFASTADSLLFDRNQEFSAVNPQAPPLLEVSIPIGASFRDNPGDIVNNSAGNGLQVSAGKTIALIGGNVTFDGGVIFAPSANVEIGGLTQSGTINFSENGSLIFSDGVTRGDVVLQNDSVINVAGGGRGSIFVNARNLDLTTSSQFLAGINLDSGSPDIQAGNIIIDATENVVFDGAEADISFEDGFTGIKNNVFAEGIGDAGKVEVTANNISLVNSGEISSLIENEGDTGDITLTATENILLSDGGDISADVEAIGNAGNINITAGTITINGFSSGISSGVLLTSSNNFSDLDGIIFAEGSGGNINIISNFLFIDRGSIQAFTVGQGNAGNINIASQNGILIQGNGEILSETEEFLGSPIGNAGDIEINTSQLSIFDSGKISSSTIFNQGNAGNINIRANLIELTGESFIQAEAFGFDTGTAGNINLETNRLIVSNASQISVGTSSNSNSGNLTIRADESIELSGAAETFRGGLIANAVDGSGNVGNINVFTNKLIIDNGATIQASNVPSSESFSFFQPGTGQPGNINIEANSIRLENGGRIETATQSEIGESANITLTVAEDIILRDNSFISAQALDNANGGNVTINADNGVILAFPNQNNDIFANAAQGNGGNIDITTQAIFGLEERFSNPPNTTNDIDASSEFGLQGDFSLNTPDVDPTSGLLQLPASVGDASDQISQNPCEKGVGSKFIITGKGGFPANPHETLNSDEVRVGLVEPLPQPLSYEERGEKRGDGATGREGEEDNHKSTRSEQLVPAMGWVFNDKGQVTLTAYDPTGNGQQRFQPTKTSCSADPKEN
jgi:filamentous hemagglutinin family protein